MKRNIITSAVIIIFFAQHAFSQKGPRLVKLWETDTIIKVPESVLFDGSRSTLFVSLIDGMPWEADGKGGIARMSIDGTTTNQEWITGLNCPKGMGIVGNKLYVADLTEVVVINIKKAIIEERIKPEGAVNLNDIAVAPKGVIYVSDSKAGRVYKIEDDKASLFMDSLPGVNGLRYMNYELAIASGKNFIRVNENKRVTKIAELPQGGDGVEPIGNNDWLVSTWMGMIFYVQADGKVITLLDTHEAKKNTADIGYDYMKRIVYVPTFFAKTVAAYQLELK
jgi:hypothetical protein